uniref:Uncharacterized protein n=1 Tax=Acrobeloides nanus TaxID=290746 RepID=A0A914DGL0_9BILA
MVYPLRLPSNAAAHILHCYQVQADVVFIGADHDYNAVLRDIQLYYPLVRKNGICMGHDYNWAGVKQAADELTEKKQSAVKFWTESTFWFMRKEQEGAHFYNMLLQT